MIVGLYAAILTIIYFLLSARVNRFRLSTKTLVGDGGNKDLERAIRVHGNFSENVLFSLFLLFLLETSNFVPTQIVHALGASLVLARMLHIYALNTQDPNDHSTAPWCRIMGSLINGSINLLIAIFLVISYGI